MIIELGKFECKSGTLLAVDPCYTEHIENSIKVKKGVWNAYLIKQDEGDWGIRNAELMILHEDYKLPDILKAPWNDMFSVAVDSGQAGFFDSEITKQRSDDDFETFYDDCCHITCDTQHYAGTLKGGVVSSSGLGDGEYGCWVMSLDNQIVAARINFLQKDSLFLDVIRIQETKQKDLPLLIDLIKTPVGKVLFEKKLKENV